ncbi:MAG: type I-E CRISPR-associated protein Cse2/CasB [Tomitella sp.]|nr:type I-E CRISPR-associated protein Cse2/CasB [Tomitella sp.]
MSTHTDTKTSAAALVRGLAAAHKSRHPGMSALLRWQYPQVDPRVIAGVAADDEPGYQAGALTAKVFALWHAGRADVHYGKRGTSLGRAMRQVGRSGAYGPRDPAAERSLTGLLDAATPATLGAAFDRAAAHLKSADHPPHWETLATDLRAWLEPDTRDAVRLRWGQAFYTSTPAATADDES